MSTLEPGTIIRVTKADDQGGHWSVKRWVDVEWNGEAFLGCERTCWDGTTERWVWMPEELLEGLEEVHNRGEFDRSEPPYLSNVTGMIEQLVAEGAF